MGEMFEDMDAFFSDKMAQGNNLHVNIAITRERLITEGRKNVAKFYTKLEEMGYNLEELKPILETTGNTLILSGAGSGKTTSLILKIIHDLLSGDLMEIKSINGMNVTVPSKVLVSTFLKTGAEELRDSFTDWCNKLGVKGVDASFITFKTIHAEVYGALKEMGVSLNIMKDGDSGTIIRQIMQAYGVHSVMSQGKQITADEVADISCLMSYVRNRLDDQRFNHPLMDEYTIDSKKFEALLLAFRQHKLALGMQDFEDLQEILLEGLKTNPKVVEFISQRYDYVYVDEFQDTSQLQYAILQYYFKGCKKILVIGDDDQCIYSWRGSDINIITHKFEQDYNPVVKQLTMNYRCAKNILQAVIPSIERNTMRHPKKLRAAKEGGEVNIVVDGNINDLLDGMREDLSEGKTVGVLARTNADLLIPTILMEMEDLVVDYGLSKAVSMTSRIPKQVFGVIDLITKRYTPDFPSILKIFLTKYKSYEADRLAGILNVNKECSIFNIPLEDIRYSVPTLFPLLNRLRNSYAESPVKAYLSALEYMQAEVYNGKSIYAQRARDFVYYIRKIINEHEIVKTMSIEEIDNLFNSVLETKITRRKSETKTLQSVKLTTVHEAKGKEWDSVYIWNDIEGCFPNSVGNRELTPSEYEEERRVHYIAWTRPRTKLTVFTRSDSELGFLKECDLSNANIKECASVNFTKKVLFEKKDNSVSETNEKKIEEVTKKEVSVHKKDKLEKALNEYYKKYTGFYWVMKSQGIYLDKCDSNLGGKEGVLKKLRELGLDSMPEDKLENAISDYLEMLTKQYNFKL